MSFWKLPARFLDARQLEQDWRHFLARLRARSQKDDARGKGVGDPGAHPSLDLPRGPIEPWEKT